MVYLRVHPAGVKSAFKRSVYARWSAYGTTCPRIGCWFFAVFITRHSICEDSNGISKNATSSLTLSAGTARFPHIANGGPPAAEPSSLPCPFGALILRPPCLLVFLVLHNLPIHPALWLDIGKPIRCRRDAAQIFFYVLFSQMAHWNLFSVAILDRRTE